jgi:glyoxylase-like metal-dependent hydrolase (beta-lactamase superfamily II)
MPAIKVKAVPAFFDNYIWLITTGGNSCAIVDPGDAQPGVQAGAGTLAVIRAWKDGFQDQPGKYLTQRVQTA